MAQGKVVNNVVNIGKNGKTEKGRGITFCWDGCGEPTRDGAEFIRGHDQTAAMIAILVDYGSVRKFVEARGYGPDPSSDYSLLETYEQMRSRRRGAARPKRKG